MRNGRSEAEAEAGDEPNEEGDPGSHNVRESAGGMFRVDVVWDESQSFGLNLKLND
jgi:hypothetical protein